jgi:hypothetical protein
MFLCDVHLYWPFGETSEDKALTAGYADIRAKRYREFITSGFFP